MLSERKTRVVLWTEIGRAEIAARLAQIESIELLQVDGPADLDRVLPGADILTLPSYYYDAHVARALGERGRDLRLVQLLTAGYEQVERHGIPATITVANASPAMAPAVAEHAVALLLALSRNLPAFVRQQQEGVWEKGDLGKLRSLSGSRVAIVGFGSIGQAVALGLRSLGAHIVAVSRAHHHNPLADEVVLLEHLHEALAQADAVVLSLPLTAAHHHLIDAAALARLHPGGLLVNIARGGLVDTAAVAAALNSGHLGGFATDVAEIEPLPHSSPLWTAPNTLITPHVAAADGKAGFRRLAEFAAVNIARYVSGDTPGHIVAIRPSNVTAGNVCE